MSSSNQKVVEQYMAACTAGDREGLLQVLHPDAVHYFSPREMKPITGADRIAQFWIDARAVDPRWAIDNMVAQGDQVVIEYTNTFNRDPGNPSTVTLNRGCEWYRLEDSRITEIRAYFEDEYGRDAGLTDYPYEARGYTSKS